MNHYNIILNKYINYITENNIDKYLENNLDMNKIVLECIKNSN